MRRQWIAPRLAEIAMIGMPHSSAAGGCVREDRGGAPPECFGYAA
jgi:hypothetical protein